MGRIIATLLIMMFAASYLSHEDSGGLTAFDAIVQGINPAWAPTKSGDD